MASGLLYRDRKGPIQCSKSALDVELRGFEPLTPSMRTRCATGLRYSPKGTAVSVANAGRPLVPSASAARPRREAGPSVADGTHLGVGVLVVELVADPGRDVDDLGTGAARAGRDRPIRPAARLRPRSARRPGRWCGQRSPGRAGRRPRGRARRRCGPLLAAAARNLPASPTAGSPTHQAARWVTAIATAPAVSTISVVSMRRRACRMRVRRSAAAGAAGRASCSCLGPGRTGEPRSVRPAPASGARAEPVGAVSSSSSSSSASARSPCGLASSGSARLLSSVPEVWGGRSHRGTSTTAQMATIAR